VKIDVATLLTGRVKLESRAKLETQRYTGNLPTEIWWLRKESEGSNPSPSAIQE